LTDIKMLVFFSPKCATPDKACPVGLEFAPGLAQDLGNDLARPKRSISMKLAFVTSTKRGEIDRLLSLTAARLEAEGARLTGVVKVLEEDPALAHDCDMDLRVLPDGPAIRITQSLGEGSTACRLNPAAIEQAVAAVERHDGPADMFILNKFGPQEAEGHGFRTTIGNALARDIPVLLGVGTTMRDAFQAFAEGMAEELPDDLDAIHAWCVAAMGKTAD